jgi:hypothetical protein
VQLTHASRGARLDPAGELVALEDQDRCLWDVAPIAEGAFHRLFANPLLLVAIAVSLALITDADPRHDGQHRTPRQNGVVPKAVTAHHTASLARASDPSVVRISTDTGAQRWCCGVPECATEPAIPAPPKCRWVTVSAECRLLTIATLRDELAVSEPSFVGRQQADAARPPDWGRSHARDPPRAVSRQTVTGR